MGINNYVVVYTGIHYDPCTTPFSVPSYEITRTLACVEGVRKGGEFGSETAPEG